MKSRRTSSQLHHQKGSAPSSTTPVVRVALYGPMGEAIAKAQQARSGGAHDADDDGDEGKKTAADKDLEIIRDGGAAGGGGYAKYGGLKGPTHLGWSSVATTSHPAASVAAGSGGSGGSREGIAAPPPIIATSFRPLGSMVSSVDPSVNGALGTAASSMPMDALLQRYTEDSLAKAVAASDANASDSGSSSSAAGASLSIVAPHYAAALPLTNICFASEEEFNLVITEGLSPPPLPPPSFAHHPSITGSGFAATVRLFSLVERFGASNMAAVADRMWWGGAEGAEGRSSPSSPSAPTPQSFVSACTHRYYTVARALLRHRLALLEKTAAAAAAISSTDNGGASPISPSTDATAPAAAATDNNASSVVRGAVALLVTALSQHPLLAPIATGASASSSSSKGSGGDANSAVGGSGVCYFDSLEGASAFDARMAAGSIIDHQQQQCMYSAGGGLSPVGSSGALLPSLSSYGSSSLLEAAGLSNPSSQQQQQQHASLTPINGSSTTAPPTPTNAADDGAFNTSTTTSTSSTTTTAVMHHKALRVFSGLQSSVAACARRVEDDPMVPVLLAIIEERATTNYERVLEGVREGVLSSSSSSSASNANAAATVVSPSPYAIAAPDLVSAEHVLLTMNTKGAKSDNRTASGIGGSEVLSMFLAPPPTASEGSVAGQKRARGGDAAADGGSGGEGQAPAECANATEFLARLLALSMPPPTSSSASSYSSQFPSIASPTNPSPLTSPTAAFSSAPTSTTLPLPVPTMLHLEIEDKLESVLQNDPLALGCACGACRAAMRLVRSRLMRCVLMRRALSRANATMSVVQKLCLDELGPVLGAPSIEAAVIERDRNVPASSTSAAGGDAFGLTQQSVVGQGSAAVVTGAQQQKGGHRAERKR